MTENSLRQSTLSLTVTTDKWRTNNEFKTESTLWESTSSLIVTTGKAAYPLEFMNICKLSCVVSNYTPGVSGCISYVYELTVASPGKILRCLNT